MTTQPGRLLTKQEMRDFRQAFPARRDADDLRCRCGHPQAEHTIQGECAIARRWRYRGVECGCGQFVEMKS